jgi:GR25 family glycosyltransferase involved in LPS biosynthesis
MKTFIIRISSNKDSVRSAEQTLQTAKDVGYTEPIEIFEAIKPNDWKQILPYPNTFNDYERPDNVAACFASHYLLWKKCVELDEPISILEHDAIFKQNIPDIEFDMCVNFGRPSYIRPNEMVYDEPKDGLDIVNQVNYLGHHAYAIKPNAAKIFCEDVKKRTLSANDVWMDKATYPWLEEYRPFPIIADTDFSTVQLMLPDENPLKQKYDEVTDVNSPHYDYLMKHFSHLLKAPQSERHIDV